MKCRYMRYRASVIRALPRRSVIVHSVESLWVAGSRGSFHTALRLPLILLSRLTSASMSSGSHTTIQAVISR